MRVSATTTAPSAADSCATLIKLSAVRNAGFTKAPMISRRTITGSNASSRIQLVMTYRPCRRSVLVFVCSGWSTGRFTAELPITIPLYSFQVPLCRGRHEAFNHSDQLMAVPGRLTILLDQSTFDHDEQS